MIKDFTYFTNKFNYYLSQLHETINSIGLHFQGQEVNLVFEVYISILNRIYVNIFSINQLSIVFQQKQVSSSIAILFRSCFSDIVLGYYLLTFINDNQTFKNETLILNQSFLKNYVKDTLPIERKLLTTDENDFSKRILEANEILRNEFTAIFEDQDSLKIKSAKMIRDENGSNKNLFKNKDVYNLELSEAVMFRHLFTLDKKMISYYEQIKILWKYFSQFQHYTFPGRHFINDKKENFLLYFFQALINNYDFLNIIVEFVFKLELSESDLIKRKLILDYNEYLDYLRNIKPGA